MESNGKEDNPFAGFSVLDMSNTLKVDNSTPEVDEKPDLDAMEKALAAEKAKIKAGKTGKTDKVDEVIEEDNQEEPENIDSKDEPSNISEDDFSYKALVKHLYDKGIVDFDEEKYKEKDFSQDEILEEVIRDTINTTFDKKKENYSEDLRKAIEWEENGGDIKQFVDYFYNKVKYSDLKFESEDIELQKAVLKDYLRSQGEEDEARIDSRIEKYELGGILEDEASIALERLQKLEKESEEGTIKAQKQAAEAKRLKDIEDWNNFKKTVLETKEIQGFEVTPKEMKDLLDHMTKPVTKDGKSQLQVNNEKNREKAQLLYAYLDMKNYDISKLEKKVKSKVTSDLRKNLGKFTDTRGKGANTPSGSDVNTEDNPFSGFRRIM